MKAVLKSVSVEGFTSIAHLRDLEIRPLTVLVGANGAGKSNFLLFFQMLNYMMSGSLPGPRQNAPRGAARHRSRPSRIRPHLPRKSGEENLPRF
jgi:predicted ATPase